MNWLQSLVVAIAAFGIFWTALYFGTRARGWFWCWRYRKRMMAKRAWMPRMGSMLGTIYQTSGRGSVSRVVDIDSGLPLRDFLRKYGAASKELNIRYRY